MKWAGEYNLTFAKKGGKKRKKGKKKEKRKEKREKTKEREREKKEVKKKYYGREKSSQNLKGGGGEEIKLSTNILPWKKATR